MKVIDTHRHIWQKDCWPEGIKRAIAEMMAKKYPGRVYSLFAIDPRRPGGVKLFEKAVTEWNAIGLNFYPPWGFYPNDPICYPFYQKALDLGVPVSIHTGF